MSTEENMVRKTGGLLLLLLLLLAAPLSVEPTSLRTRKFTHHKHTKSWSEAQTSCRQQQADLVSITHQEDNQDFARGQGWMGLYREDSASQWKWSRRGEKANFTSWAPGEPDEGQNCAFKFNKQTVWHSDACSAKHSYMCSAEKLLLVREKKTWEEALQHCRTLEGAEPGRYDLASLQTDDDHDFAREISQTASSNQVWTGLRLLAGRWLWAGGEEVQYQDLPRCSPRRCGTLEKTGTRSWQIRDCAGIRINFLCYRKP